MKKQRLGKGLFRGGCNGCHVIGQEVQHLILTGTLLRHENGDSLYNFILDP